MSYSFFGIVAVSIKKWRDINLLLIAGIARNFYRKILRRLIKSNIFKESMRKSSLADIIFWLSIGTLFLWALAKSLGLINTPVWIELLPLFSLSFAAGAFWSKFEYTLKRMERFEKRLSAIEIIVELKK